VKLPRLGVAVRWTLLSFIISLCIPLSLQAQSIDGVGRFETGEQLAFCSGTLVAPDLVLTAAHCVAKYEAQPPTADGKRFGFRPGRLRGAPLIEAKHIILHPLYHRALNNLQKLRFDLALVQLAEPVEAHVSTHLSHGDEAEHGEALFIVSWRGTDGGSPRQKRCAVQNGNPGLVTLDCEVFLGESGSPVLRQVEGGLEVVAVVSSRGQIGARPIAQASNVAARLPALLHELARAQSEAGS